MKPVVVTLIVIGIMALISGVFFYQFAQNQMKKVTFGEQPGAGLGLVFNSLIVDAVLSFVLVWFLWKPLALVKEWAVRIATGIGVLGFVILLYEVMTRGMVEYANQPLSWSGLAFVACSIGTSFAAFFKRA